MGRKILVADDSIVFRLLEARLLETRGYQVVQAADGIEALRCAVDEQPDLILLDIQMPLMDGVQVLATLKRQEATRDIPVIVISTIGREKDRDIMLRGGADDFISKPIDGSNLLRRVGELVSD
jgi:twitching motility two-component system response regulator PilH